MAATGEREREAALAACWSALGHRYNATGLTEPIPVAIGSYHSRPAQVLMADRYTHALLATINDPHLQVLPTVGAIDQVLDSTDVLTTPALYRRLASLYTAAEASTSTRPGR